MKNILIPALTSFIFLIVSVFATTANAQDQFLCGPKPIPGSTGTICDVVNWSGDCNLEAAATYCSTVDYDLCFYDDPTFDCSILQTETEPDPVTQPADPGQTAIGICTVEGEIDTAIGCISFLNLSDFSKFWILWGLGITGGAAVVLLSIASFQIMTSSGDPGKIAGAKEMITATISGLLLLAMSALLLRLIGVDILGILNP